MFKTTQALTFAVLTIIVVGFMVALFSGDRGFSSAFAAETADQAGERGWGRHGGVHGGGHGRGPGRLCKEGRMEKRIDHMTTFVDSFIDFNQEQDEAWNNLVTTVRANSGTVMEVCQTLRAKGDTSAPERFAMAEQAMEKALASVKDVRPAFDSFYATLDDKQKAMLDRMASRGRRH